jgi:hypothetical protein
VNVLYFPRPSCSRLRPRPGVFALQRWWRNGRATLSVVFVICYFTLLYVVTIASVRYRLPIEPLLFALAAQPLSAGLLRILARRTGCA